MESEKESQDEPEILEEATIDQEIRQMPIDPTVCTSPLITISNTLPSEQPIMSTQTVTATTTTTSAFGLTPTPQQRIASAMQKAKGKGGGPPGGGTLGGGGGGPPGGPQPVAPQQPIAPAADVKAMGSLPQIFTRD